MRSIYLKSAIMFRDNAGRPTGVIAKGLKEEAKKRGIKFCYDSMSHSINRENVIYFSTPPPKVKTDSKIGWWICDLRHPAVMPNETTADVIFLCNKEYIKQYERKYNLPVHFIPQPGLIPKYRNGLRWYDIVFIGNQHPEYHANRKPIIDKISEYKKVKWITGEGQTTDQEFIYSQSKISLAISPRAKGYTSNRLFNILISGGFCLTLYYPGIEDMFENHHHLVWFHTADEAKSLAKFYLKNDSLRKQIARQGWKEANEKHTAANRIDSMLKILADV